MASDRVRNRLTMDLMAKLESMAFNYDDDINFKMMFGEKTGEHLHNKYRQYDRNLMKLYNALDVQNKKKFIEFVNNLPSFK